MTETTIEPGLVLAGTSDNSPLPGLHRVLEVASYLDQVTLIPIPSIGRDMPGKKQKSYYAKGFFLRKLSQLKFWLETDAICLLYTSPSPRDATLSRMPSSA